MRRPSVLLVLILLNSIFLACNQGNSRGLPAIVVGPNPVTTPTPNPIKTLTFVNGLNDQPVAGASISINNREYFTNDSGQIVATTDQGDSIDVLAKGYLNRNTLFLGDLKFTLWPSREPGYEASFVYDELDRRLYKPNTGTYTVWVGEDIANDKNASARIDQFLAAAAYATRGKIQFRRTESDQADIRITVEPGNPDVQHYAALSYLGIKGYVIVENFIVIREWRSLMKENTLLHELGHFMGLGHSYDIRDVMCPNKMDRGTIDFSSREMDTLFMMTLRRAGQVFSDNDRVLESKYEKGKSTILYQCK